MAHKVTIECEARFVDHLSGKANEASDSINDIGSAAEKAQKKVDNLGKKKFRPIFDADNNKFLKKIRDAEARAEKLGKTKTTMTLNAIDKATTVIGKVLNKAQSFGGSVWSAVMRVKDSQAMEALGRVTSAAKGIAGKTWEAIVKIKDYATTPLKKIKDSLFSIKTLVTAVTAGFAAKKFILEPINLADAYSSAHIGFSTLLGDKEGQAMMDKIDEFAKATPFKTSGVISNVQKMMAYGWDADRIIKDMETIGDAAAATGKGDEGLSSIVYALSEIRSKGKLSTQELNQLASAGIKAKAYLAEGLGYGSDDKGMAQLAADLEKGAIGANQAIDLILQGMEEFDGMMDKTANETVEGLWSQIQDVFEINIFRKWGQGLQDGAKKGFGSIVSLLNESEGALSALGDTLYAVGKSMSNWAADKLEKAVSTIKEVTQTSEFKNANLGGKIKILWNEVIAEPFSDWWNSSGKKKIADIASDVGSGIGAGLTFGLLALLGFNAEDALVDGISIGGSFMEGFLQGFDTNKIGEALKNWVENNKGLATAIGVLFAGKLIAGIGNVFRGGSEIWNTLSSFASLFGGKGNSNSTGGALLSDAYANTMNVTAGVVNVYGGIGTGKTASDIVDNVTDTYAAYKLSQGGKNLLTGKGLKYLLPGATGAGKLLDAAGDAKKIYTYTNAAGDVIGTSSKFGAFTGKMGTMFAKAFPKLSKGLSKAAPWLTVLDFAVDGVSGFAKSKREGDGTGHALLKGLYKSVVGDYDADGVGGKIWGAVGNTLKGAGLGLAIGGPLGAAIGAGAGLSANLGAQLGHSKLPEWAKGALATINPLLAPTMLPTEFVDDPGGFINRAIVEPFKKAGEHAAKLGAEHGKKAATFLTETIPNAFNDFKDKAATLFTETIPNGWNSMWSSIGNFFVEKVPYAIGYATGKVAAFFTQTIPAAWDSFWGVVGKFFTETIPYYAGFLWSKISTFFTETIPAAWDSFWGIVGKFFTETIPYYASILWSKTVVFFTETLPAVWDSFWGAISTFFTETLPEWASNVWNNNIVPFFTETIPAAWDTLWGAIGTFFTETIPEWASSVWNNNIVPFFTETIPGFFSSLWDSVSTFFTETLGDIAQAIWAPISTFFTETVPGWVSSAIEKVKSTWNTMKENFLSGFEAGSGGKSGKKARGGFVGGKSSSMEAFARGGRTDGGVLSRSTRWIRVNEESPEMIIPLSSQRRERAMKLWAKTGQLLGVPGFARGGNTAGGQDEGIRFHGTDPEPRDTRSVVVDVGGISIEIKVDATNKENVVQAIKEQIADIAESVAGIFADEFEAIFENTPVRGEVN